MKKKYVFFFNRVLSEGNYVILINFTFQFFVASDPTVKDDRLWREKYTLRKSMVPTFLSTSQAQKVSFSMLVPGIFKCFHISLKHVISGNSIFIGNLIPVVQGGHGTGKTGNLAVNFSRQGKHREFSKFNFLHRENGANTGKILKI